MTDMQANPARTFALVVGIERYDTNENWDLKTDESWDLIGPAQDARRFVEWLRSRGVPAENISLFLAPLDGGLRRHGTPPEQPATSDLIRHAIITTLPAKQGDLLYVFWSGRSVRTAEREHQLLYIDVNEQGRQNLNPDTLLSLLRSSTFSQLPRQIFIFDTYTHAAKKRNSLTLAPATTLAPGQNMPSIQQFVLFAASQPTTSIRSPRLFSNEVLQQLTEAQTSLLPDMDALARQLHERFEALRKKRATARIPNYDYTDWNGQTHKYTYPVDAIEIYISDSGEEVGIGFPPDTITDWEPFRLERDLIDLSLRSNTLEEWVTTALTSLSKKDASIRNITQNEGVQKLVEIVFGRLVLEDGPLHDDYQQKIEQLPSGQPLQIRLSVPAKLSSVPWELLRDDEYWLAREQGRTFARLPRPTTQTKPEFLNNTYDLHKRTNPLHIVVVASSHTLDHAEEFRDHINILRRRFECVLDKRVLTVEYIDKSDTYQKLLARLEDPKPIHVLHIFAHSEIPRDEYNLLLTGSKEAAGSSSRTQSKKGAFEGAGLRGSDLRDALCKRHAAHPNQLQLVVLNANYSAREPQNPQLRSLAAGIVLDGVPAVVAVQGKLKPDVLTLAMPTFYDSILDAEPIDRSINRARDHIHKSSETALDWTRLVLFVHPGATDLRLFEQRVLRDEQQVEITRGVFLQAQSVGRNPSNEDFFASKFERISTECFGIFVPSQLRQLLRSLIKNRIKGGFKYSDIVDRLSEISISKDVKQLSELRNFFFFAEPGNGKTSYRMRVERELKQNGLKVRFNYNHTSFKDSKDHERTHFDILRHNVFRSLQQHLQDQSRRIDIESHYPDNWAFFQRLQTEFNPSKKNKRFTNQYILDEWMKELIEFIKLLDLQEVHCIFDNFDTIRDENLAMNILDPLISIILSLMNSNVAFKFFLPATRFSTVWNILNVHGEDIELFWLDKWTRDQLQNMLNRRLEVFSGGSITSFQQLCAKDCREDIGQSLCQAANGSPQRLIELVDGLISEHCKHINDPETRIPQRLIDDFLERE